MKRVIFIAVMCAFVAAPAVADPYGTVQVKYRNYTDSPVLYRETTVYDSIHMGTAVGRVVTGIYRLDMQTYVDNGGNPLNLSADEIAMLSGKVDSFCTDIIDNPDKSNFRTYNVSPLEEIPDPVAGPMGDAKAIDAAELLYMNWTSSLDAAQAAAIQAALWEIVNEDSGTYALGQGAAFGNFQMWGNSSVVSAANLLLGNLTPDAQQVDYRGYFVGLTSPSYQDFVVKVPLPGAVLLGILGLGVAGLKLRKFA
jgi:hypothetical protein